MIREKKQQRKQTQQELLREYASGKTVQEIADENNRNYQWVYQRLYPLQDFKILRRVRREQQRHWLQKRCPNCKTVKLRSEFPPSHHWCKSCRRDYYREYHRRKKNEA